MPVSRVVRPESVRLDISGGDWLLVKRQLNAGEQRRAFARITRERAPTNGDGASRIEVDPLQTGVSLILSYLLDWSLIDEAGNVIDIREADEAGKLAALDAIDYDSFVEIKNAIERHQQAMEAQAAAKKTLPAGSPPSDATSPLPDAAAGDTSG